MTHRHASAEDNLTLLTTSFVARRNDLLQQVQVGVRRVVAQFVARSLCTAPLGSCAYRLACCLACDDLLCREAVLSHRLAQMGLGVLGVDPFGGVR